MVYRGKPSSGCGECRKRRTRCDQATPCGQCVKTGRKCPGYRNAVDLLFRDESARVIERSKGLPPKSVTTSIENGSEVATRSLAPIKLFNVGTRQLCDDLGVKFFMSNYVGADPDVSPLHYLPDFYTKSGYATSSLKRTIIACGLAGYGRATSRTDLIRQSTKTYVAAIRDLNTILSTPSAVVRDTTLMSIIVAAIFETILISPDSGMQNISKHMEGAMSVAYLSLQQREPSALYKILLRNLIQSVVMNCWIQHLPLPPNYEKIRSFLPKNLNPHSVHAKLLDILSSLIEFRVILRKRSCSKPIEILQRALSLDASLKTFVEEMPNSTLYNKCWMSNMQATEVQQLAYNCFFHVYPQQFAGHFWNNVRFCRINLHQLIHQQCSVLLSSNVRSTYTNLCLQRSASESLTILLAEEICATVPQLLSYCDYLDQFVSSTEFAPPIRMKPSMRDETPLSSGSSDHTKPPAEDLRSNLPTPKHSTASSQDSTPSQSPSSSTSNGDAPKGSVTMLPLSTPGARDFASYFRLLMVLESLKQIPWLPLTMKSWIRDRISWIEINSDPNSAARVKEMVHKRPADGFPVSDAPGQIPHGSICEAIALTPTDQTLWFLAHSWLFVGLDWNADCHSETTISTMDITKDPRQSV